MPVTFFTVSPTEISNIWLAKCQNILYGRWDFFSRLPPFLSPRITAVPSHYCSTITLQQSRHITEVPLHYSSTITLQQYHHITTVPSHYSSTITLQRYHHITAVPSHYSSTITLQQHHLITVAPSHYSSTITLQQHHHITAAPSQATATRLSHKYSSVKPCNIKHIISDPNIPAAPMSEIQLIPETD